MKPKALNILSGAAGGRLVAAMAAADASSGDTSSGDTILIYDIGGNESFQSTKEGVTRVVMAEVSRHGWRHKKDLSIIFRNHVAD